jgi:hypothetical protein
MAETCAWRVLSVRYSLQCVHGATAECAGGCLPLPMHCLMHVLSCPSSPPQMSTMTSSSSVRGAASSSGPMDPAMEELAAQVGRLKKQRDKAVREAAELAAGLEAARSQAAAARSAATAAQVCAPGGSCTHPLERCRPACFAPRPWQIEHCFTDLQQPCWSA